LGDDMNHQSVSLLSKQTILCPICRNEAEITISEYSTQHEDIVIISLKCNYCSYRRSDIIPIASESIEKCIEIEIKEPKDLNTLLYIPQDTTISIPEIGVEVDVKELTLGSYITVDGILFEVAEKMRIVCLDQKLADNCIDTLQILNDIISGNVKPLTIRLMSLYGGIRVVKTYRENYKKKC
ncbi:MAG: hypothetical protein QXG46_04880, partial [Ignisphaera sp.]